MAQEVRICRTNKRGWVMEDDARSALEIIRRNNLNRAMSGMDVPNKIYLCPYCREWHLSHSARRKWRK